MQQAGSWLPRAEKRWKEVVQHLLRAVESMSRAGEWHGLLGVLGGDLAPNFGDPGELLGLKLLERAIE